MAQTIKLKRSATSGAVPTTSALDLGEMAINTHDGKVYIKKNDGAESVVEVGADQTPAELLTAIKTVDGSGSGLDADLLDGYQLSTTRNAANTVPVRDANGYANFGWINTTSGQTSNTITKIYGSYAGDNYLRWFAPSTIISQQGIWTSSNDGSGSGLDADLLDGQHGSYYAAASHNHTGTYTPYDHIRSLGVQAFTNGTNPNITTAQIISEIEFDGGFDSHSSVFKTSWSYAGNYNLTDAGRFTETAGTSWLTWTDNSSDTTRGNITALAIAPNTGGSAGKMFVYNDQGGSYSPGWREIWTSTSDGAGSGLDADLLDGQHGSYYYPASNPNGYTNDQTAAEILTAIKTVDGSSSGLDADLLDGQQGSYYYPASNPNGYTSNVGDITGVTAGTGLTGGGTSGTPTLNVIGGDGITANADNITVDSTVVRTSGTQSIGGGKSFGNILTVDGSETGGYPLQRLTSSSVSTYGRIEFGYTGQVSRGRLQYNNTGDSMAFYTDSAERARVTSAGDILVNKTASNASVRGCQLSSNGTIYSTIDISSLTGGIQVRNNALTDSLTGIRCYNGLADIPTTSSTGGGHSLSISGGLSGEYARFTNAKRLGIGTTAPAESLHVVGNIVATGNITAYYSDERLKDLKGTIPNALDKVNQLNGYYYTPNETAQALGVDNKGLEVGISAQEVEAVLPEIVTKSAIGDDYKTVWYEKLTPLLIEAVKELTEKVDKLEARLTELEK